MRRLSFEINICFGTREKPNNFFKNVLNFFKKITNLKHSMEGRFCQTPPPKYP